CLSSINLIKRELERRQTSVVGTGRTLESLILPQDLFPLTDWIDLREVWSIVNGHRLRLFNKLTGLPLAIHREGEAALTLSPNGLFAITALPFESIPSTWEQLYGPPYPESAIRIRSGSQNVFGDEGPTYINGFVVLRIDTGEVVSATSAPTGAWSGWESDF